MFAAIDSISTTQSNDVSTHNEGTNWAEVSRQAREFLVTDHEDSWSPTWIRSFNPRAAFGR